MSVIDTLITDRTQADVNAVYKRNADALAKWTVSQKAEYLAGMKGSYTVTDLNRVGEACTYLYDLMQEMGYNLPGYVALKTDWGIADIPTAAQMQDYIGTVAALKAAWDAAQTIPQSMNGIDFENANDIERLLIEVNETLTRIGAIYIRSGAWNAFSGTGFYIKN